MSAAGLEGGDGAPSVLLDVDADGVALVRFNRPDRKNGWTYEMEERYFATLDQVEEDPAVRAIVVTGAGTAFCPGLDVAQLAAVKQSGTVDFSSRRPMTRPLSVRKPMVAAINGACAGVGLLQALMCDVRFVAADARISTAFSRRGLVAEHGIAWLLPRVVGRENAADLLLSGRVFDGLEAKELGLVSRVVKVSGSVLDEALAYARDLALHCSPMAMAVIKHQLDQAEGRSQEEVRQHALSLVTHYLAHPDMQEGVSSFTERRAPQFAALPSGFDPVQPLRGGCAE